jgi:hypothetical protein
MAKPNPLDVAEKVDELSPATKEKVAEALGVDPTFEQFEKAFGNAARRGLVEQQGDPQAGSASWTVSDKGRRRLAARAEEA